VAISIKEALRDLYSRADRRSAKTELAKWYRLVDTYEVSELSRLALLRTSILETLAAVLARTAVIDTSAAPRRQHRALPPRWWFRILPSQLNESTARSAPAEVET
jgi:hypothetical protein